MKYQLSDKSTTAAVEASGTHLPNVSGKIVMSLGATSSNHKLTKHVYPSGFIVMATILPHESRDHLQDPNIHVFNLDVTSEDGIKAFKEAAMQVTDGSLDILVNNA